MPAPKPGGMFNMARIKTFGRAAALMALAFGSQDAWAQAIRIQNAWKTDQKINVEASTTPVAAPTPDGFVSGQWQFEQVPNTDYVRIKNIWRGTYLNVETGSLQTGAIQPGWLSAMWKLVGMSVPGTYRIENAWTKAALNVEGGTLVASSAPLNWQSAIWTLPGYVSGTRMSAATMPTAPDPFAGRQEILATPVDQYGAPIQDVAAGPVFHCAVDDPEAHKPAEIAKCLNRDIAQPVKGAFESGGTVAKPFEQGYAAVNSGFAAAGNALRYGFTGNPQEYTVDIDICHSGLKGTGTGDTITLYLYDDAGTNFAQGSAYGTSGCNVGISITTATKVARFSLGTSGTDPLYLDEVKFITGKSWFSAGTVISDSGRDEGSGWCLSKDPSNTAVWQGALAFGCAELIQFPR